MKSYKLKLQQLFQPIIYQQELNLYGNLLLKNGKNLETQSTNLLTTNASENSINNTI